MFSLYSWNPIYFRWKTAGYRLNVQFTEIQLRYNGNTRINENCYREEIAFYEYSFLKLDYLNRIPLNYVYFPLLLTVLN